jgi:capsular polysaccharide biosynthesis protein
MTKQTQSTFDLRGVLNALRLRWWIVLVTTLIAVFAVFAQESDLKITNDGNTVTVTKTYEAKIETSALQIAQVDPSSVVPFPNFDNQVGVLRSAEVLAEIQGLTGNNAIVEVTRSEPKFTMVDTLDEADNRVTFLSRGTSTYTYLCRGLTPEDCDKSIDAFVDKTSELRKEGTIGGLKAGQELLAGLVEDAENRLQQLTNESAPAATVSAQAAKLIDLQTKSTALDFTADKVSGTLVLANSSVVFDGPTVSSVTASSYAYGGVLGVIIGILIVVQLGMTDKKVRSKRQINRGQPGLSVLGDIDAGNGLQEGVAAVVASARAQSVNLIRVVGLGGESSTLSSFNKEVAKHSLQLTPLPLFSTLTAEALFAPEHSAMLLVAVKGISRIDSLQQAVEAAQLAGNQVLGVLLVSAD